MAIDPDTDRLIRWLLQQGHITELDIMKLPKGYSCVFVAGSSISRDHFGPFAATTASAWPLIAFHRLRQAIWLASGIMPVTGDSYVTELSVYPVTDFWRIPVGLQTYPSDVVQLSDAQINLLARVAAQLDYVMGGRASMDRETEVQIRLALSHADVVQSVKDNLVAALLEYIVIDALLLRKEDHESRLAPRVAWLIGADVSARRSAKKLVQAFGRLRDGVAHGSPPPLEVLSAVVGRKVAPHEFDVYFSWSGHEAGSLLDRQCRELMRRALLCFLNLALIVGSDGNVTPALTRGMIIDTLENADKDGPRTHSARQQLQENARSVLIESGR
ncbi:MAG: hypothetical protein HYY03_07875 [Chloroflexi bacterium]|nr:hypothetical protein [Chloroflexota bacterium]